MAFLFSLSSLKVPIVQYEMVHFILDDRVRGCLFWVITKKKLLYRGSGEKET